MKSMPGAASRDGRRVLSGGGSQDADRLGYFMLKRVNKAIREFGMIRDGDRIAVAVSGGKDSLALLSLLQLSLDSTKTRYELAAIHVRGDSGGITPPHLPLEEWLAVQRIPYRAVEPELREDERIPLNCQRCTWLRRKALFTAADQMGCNVLALAHHADDAAQTTLLSLLYGGVVHTVAPCADYFDRFRVIRPLIFVPEKELVRFARASGFPAPPPACARGPSTRRRLVADMLKILGHDYGRQVRANLIRAGLRNPPDTGCSTPARGPARGH